MLEEGKTRIRHRHIISPPVAGMLERIPLRAGDRIEAGKTVLATHPSAPSSFLDPRAQAEAEARVKAAEANQQLRAGPARTGSIRPRTRQQGKSPRQRTC